MSSTALLHIFLMLWKRRWCSMGSISLPLALSVCVPPFCYIISIFLCNIYTDLHVIGETFNESDKQTGSYNMYCTSVFPLEHGFQEGLSSCQYMPCTYHVAKISSARKMKMGRRQEDSTKWDKKNETNEEEIGKHESIFIAKILMYSCVCLCKWKAKTEWHFKLGTCRWVCTKHYLYIFDNV